MVSKESIITGAVLILITYTLSLSLVSQAFPAEQTTKTLSSTGSIQTSIGLGVYTNPECTIPLTSLSWGTLQPGGSQNLQCYIKNESNMPTTITMSTDNWSPSNAGNYLTLNWNYDSNPVAVGNVVHITFTLTVSPSIEGITTFSFDINIVGSSV
jgi:hypothetical protein